MEASRSVDYDEAVFTSYADNETKNPLAANLRLLLTKSSDDKSPQLDESALENDRLLASGLSERMVKPCLDLVLENSANNKLKVKK